MKCMMIFKVCNQFAPNVESLVLEQEQNIRADLARNRPLVGPQIPLAEYRSDFDPDTRTIPSSYLNPKP